MVNPKTALQRLATDATGVYVLEAGKLSRYTLGTGAPAEPRPGLSGNWIEDLAIGLDGSVTTVGHGEAVTRIGTDGRKMLEVKDAISTVSDRRDPSIRVAVDGNGEIYLLGRFHDSVFHYTSTGKFVNRIGSGGNGEGQLRSPHDVAVDGQGRIYIADSNGILVFAPDGRYLHTFGSNRGMAFGLAFDEHGDLYAACRTHIVKFRPRY